VKFPSERESMEDETYRLIALWVFACQEALRRREPEGLERGLSCLMPIVIPAAGKNDRTDLLRARDDLRTTLYGQGTRRDEQVLSRALDEGEALLITCCTILYDKHLLLGTHVDLNSISAS
jgi:hypothetical protein